MSPGCPSYNGEINGHVQGYIECDLHLQKREIIFYFHFLANTATATCLAGRGASFKRTRDIQMHSKVTVMSGKRQKIIIIIRWSGSWGVWAQHVRKHDKVTVGHMWLRAFQLHLACCSFWSSSRCIQVVIFSLVYLVRTNYFLANQQNAAYLQACSTPKQHKTKQANKQKVLCHFID